MIDLDGIRERDAADMQILPNLELFAQHNPDDAELKGAIDMVRDRRALLAYVDALAKDAERYRWLRDSAGNDIMEKLMAECSPPRWDELVDAAIDAAMGEKP